MARFWSSVIDCTLILRERLVVMLVPDLRACPFQVVGVECLLLRPLLSQVSGEGIGKLLLALTSNLQRLHLPLAVGPLVRDSGVDIDREFIAHIEQVFEASLASFSPRFRSSW